MEALRRWEKGHLHVLTLQSVIDSALGLLVTPTPENGSKEEYWELIEALAATRAMLKGAQA